MAEIDDAIRRHELDGPRWWRALAADLAGGGEQLDVAGHLRREADRRRHRPPPPVPLRPASWSRRCWPSRRSCSSTRSATAPCCATPSPAGSPSRSAAATPRATSRRCWPRRSAGRDGGALAGAPRQSRLHRSAVFRCAANAASDCLPAERFDPRRRGAMASGGSAMADAWLRSALARVSTFSGLAGLPADP